MKKFIATFLAVLLIIMLFWYAKRLYQPAKKLSSKFDFIKTVQIIKAEQRAVDRVFDTIAKLQPITSIDIVSAVAGRIESISANSGIFVNKGQLLANFVTSEIKAPFAGYLTNWQQDSGAYVAIGTPLVKLIDKSKIKIEYYVPEHYSSQLTVGQEVVIYVRAYQGSKFHGKVQFISPIVEEKNHSILVRAIIDNADFSLLPGSFAKISHILKKQELNIVVPESCLVQNFEGYHVYKVVDNKLLRQVVVPDNFVNSKAYIREGISVGDEIVLTLYPEISEGKKVTTSLWQGEW